MTQVDEVDDADLGAVFEIRDVLVDDPSMSPMEIWCNESQERYVLAVGPEDRAPFEAIAKRDLPLVFSTGYGGAGIREPFRDRPVVQKPFSQADLKRTLIGAIRAARA